MVAPKIKRPDIFKFHDYREFLKNWFEHLKHGPDSRSMRQIAVLSQIGVGYLPMVVSGKRSLSEKAIDSMSPHLGLSENEIDYLKLLCKFQESKEGDEKKKTFELIKGFRSYQRKNSNEVKVHKYMRNWPHVVIRELVDIEGFEADPKWIRRRLTNKVPLATIASAIRFLVSEGFLEADANNKLKQKEKQLDCDGEVFKLALSDFHTQMLKQAIDSIYNVERERRHIVSHTMAFPEAEFAKVKAILEEAFVKIRSLGESAQKSDSVYHVAFQAFPVASQANVSGEEEILDEEIVENDEENSHDEE